MPDVPFLDSPLFTWVILPLMIFCARIVDVSMQTIRLLLIMAGRKNIAPVIGFFESLTWLLAIGQIMQHLDNIACFLAYSGGFAAGTWVGIYLEERIAMGMVIVRVITRASARNLLDALKEREWRYTAVDAEGSRGPVNLIFAVIRRKDISNFVAIVNDFNPNAFYSIENVRSVSEQIMPLSGTTRPGK